MTGESNRLMPLARTILHPTDFSPDSDRALEHALRLALDERSDLIILHVGKKNRWKHFPSVREILERWELIEPGAPRSAVSELGIGIDKIAMQGPDVVDAVSSYLDDHDVDLLVMATHPRHGIAGWLRPSMAEQTARRSHVATLFVPTYCHRCVSPQDGSVSMRSVLVPVDHQPRAKYAIEWAYDACRYMGDPEAELVLLHVGPENQFPPFRIPGDDVKVQHVSRSGHTVTEILDEAQQRQTDLIVMATEGRHGIFDALRGSTTEQVLHASPCPMLAVPSQTEGSRDRDG